MTWSDPALEAIAELVHERTGLSFAARREGTEHGIHRAMTRARISDPVQFAEQLATDPELLDDLIDELTVGETYFFREHGHFQFIKDHVLPELCTRPLQPVRAWSAGCASGEEAYSLAILLAQQGLADRAHLLATDISRAALAKARRAVYGPWSLRGTHAEIASPYLTPVGKEFRLDERIRRTVRFFHLNLALDAYPSFANGIWGMDLILCRNVLIYFDRDTVHAVARRLFESLAEGAWLITASSDPPLWEDAPFDVVTRAEGVFYRRPSSRAIARMPDTADVATPIIVPTETGPLDVESDGATVAPNVAQPSTANRLDEARQAYRRGEYERVLQNTADLQDDEFALALRIRALANLKPANAEACAAIATRQHPLAAELHYLHAMLLMELNRADEAVQAMRRVLYLDQTLAAAHFALGSILMQRGDQGAARRAFRNARDLCKDRPREESVPLADGETAGRLAEVAAAELALLDSHA